MRILKLALCAILMWAASASPLSAQQQGPVVLAAASLQEALEEAANAWAAKKHPKPLLSFAASSALARQVEQGAPADLFISADEDWMNYLDKGKLLYPGSRSPFLTNRLVLIEGLKGHSQLAIKRGFPLARMLGSGRLAIADPDSVPAGKYAKAALTYYGIWPQVAAKIAPADNVRSALLLVERGETPFGIVYATDAAASKKVRVVATFPTASHPPIVYPIARLKTSTSPAAEPFRQFLRSAEGKAIFRRHGFGTA